jgi:hypothetical protein
MNADANLQIMILGAMLVFSWLVAKLVRYNKTKRINTELWCTIFEGLTQGAIRLDDLKAPESVIEKKVRRDGKDEDNCDVIDIENKTIQRNARQVNDV